MRLLDPWSPFVCALVLLASGCAVSPPHPPNVPAHALVDVESTRLAQLVVRNNSGGDRALSGFRLLPEGETAFNARIALARRAEKSLDAQYYLIQNDDLGQQFLRELRDAAVRGVRVRLLVDDLFTAGEDDLLSGLAAYPNVEVRLFNPLPARSGSFGWRLLMSMREFGRINHRMHNKLFVADNSFAVSGGRNIADEYFMRGASSNFIDIDVLSSGPVVRQLSGIFDRYWNSEHAVPIERLIRPVPQEQRRRRFDALVSSASTSIPERLRDVLGQPSVAEQLDGGNLTQSFASAEAYADTPDKVQRLPGATEQTVTDRTLALFAEAHSDVYIASPYFIPGERGMAIIRAVGATQENGRLTLVTNSLGSTDEPLVYAGYARYRLALLRAGVRIYEIGATLGRTHDGFGNFGSSISRLHAKVAAIDGRRLFVGSMNLDSRSESVNTEVGLVIDSPELASSMARLVGSGLTTAYRLRLGGDGEQIEWVETDARGRETVHAREPDDNLMLRWKLWLLSRFVDEGLL